MPPPTGRIGCFASRSSVAASWTDCRPQNRSASPAASNGCCRYGPRHLAAQPRRRHQLAGVGEPGGVERAAQALERVEVGLVEHLRHVLLLVHADAVLAGDRAAGVQAGVDDQAAQLLGALGLALDPAVVADQRVQVAVAGVEDVGHDQVVLARHLVDPLEHLGQLRARDHAVLDEVVRRDPAHRRERRLAHLPEQRALGLVARDPHVVGAAALADRHHLVEAGLALALGAVELDQQRGGARAPARLAHLLGRLDRARVHHLDRARDDAALHDRRHRLAGLVGGVEERDERLHRLRGRARRAARSWSPRRASPRSRRTRRAGRSPADRARSRRSSPARRRPARAPARSRSWS